MSFRIGTRRVFLKRPRTKLIQDTIVFNSAYLIGAASGWIQYDGSYTVTTSGTTFSIGRNRIGSTVVQNTYLSYDTSSIPDNATITSASFSLVTGTAFSVGTPTPVAIMKIGADIIGAALDSSDYSFPGSETFYTINPLASKTTYNMSINSSHFDQISLTGATDIAAIDSSFALPGDAVTTQIQKGKCSLTVNFEYLVSDS